MSDVAHMTYYLFLIKINSPQFYGFIVKYIIEDMNFGQSHLLALSQRLAVNFIHGMFYSNQGLDNQDFFDLISGYLSHNLESFNKLELYKLLDMFKFNEKFSAQNLSLKLQMED